MVIVCPPGRGLLEIWLTQALFAGYVTVDTKSNSNQLLTLYTYTSMWNEALCRWLSSKASTRWQPQRQFFHCSASG